LDEIGRTRLRTLCADFHWQCSKMSRDDEIKQLQWRVQALARGSAPPAPPHLPRNLCRPTVTTHSGRRAGRVMIQLNATTRARHRGSQWTRQRHAQDGLSSSARPRRERQSLGGAQSTGPLRGLQTSAMAIASGG
jgi:hypothetical protein